MSTVFRPCPNPQCNRGAITTMKPAPALGSKLKSSVHLAPMNRQCDTCKGAGRVKGAPAPADDSPPREEAPVKLSVSQQNDGTIVIGGYRIAAPTFHDADQFDRAIQRAFDDGLRVEPTSYAGRFQVINPASRSVYTTSRSACICHAGQTGTPCKHVALVCFLLDVSHDLEVA